MATDIPREGTLDNVEIAHKVTHKWEGSFSFTSAMHLGLHSQSLNVRYIWLNGEGSGGRMVRREVMGDFEKWTPRARMELIAFLQKQCEREIEEVYAETILS